MTERDGDDVTGPGDSSDGDDDTGVEDTLGGDVTGDEDTLGGDDTGVEDTLGGDDTGVTDRGDGSASGSQTSADPADSLLERVPDRIVDNTVLSVVVGVVALALIARFVALGARPTHWDEARVAYWTLYAHEQGSFVYRHIIHGPFVQHASRWLFGIFGVSDTIIRIPVAIVGGLLPLSALLFRERLRDSEVIALALVLSFNPVLLYYSRFMRSDVLVGGFMFVALGLAVRFLDTRNPRYFYGIGAFVTLAVASKENAILYLVTWGGALVLLADRELDRPGSETTGIQRVYRAGSRIRNAPFKSYTRTYLPHAVGAAVLSAVLFLFMFAPRGAGMDGLFYPPADPSTGVSLGSALSAPGEWPALVDATWSQFASEYGAWGDGTEQLTFEEYRERLEGMLKAMLLAGGALTAFSLIGFARERYGVANGRPLVMLLFFAAGASLVGYPIGLSITSGYKWNVTHVLLPLAIPAAVGLGVVGRTALSTYLDEDAVGRGLLTIVVLSAVVLVSWQAAQIVYLDPQHESNVIVQGAQPDEDFAPLIADMEAAAESEGPDALIYSNTSMRGSFVRAADVSSSEGVYMNFRPICTDWPETLPLDWYLASTDVETDCARSTAELRTRVQENSTPMIITRHGDDSVPHEWLTERYEATTYNLRFSDHTPPRTVVYVRSDVARGT